MRVAFGEFVLDPESRQLFRNGEEVALVPKALDLLDLLVQERPRAVSKERIHDRLWPRTFVSESTLTSLVADLRTALGDDAKSRHYIRTVRGFGYAFSGEVPGTNSAAANPAAGRSAPLLPRRAVGLLFVAGLVAATILGMRSRVPTPAANRPLMRLNAELGADATLATGFAPAAILSPDGSSLAFVARESSGGRVRLFVRRLDQLRATALSGTEGAHNPFFSADGQSIGYFAEGKLKRISVAGGTAMTLCDAPNDQGGSWAGEGSIIFAPNWGMGGLVRVSAAGGEPEPVTALAPGEVTQRWPQALDGGRAVLFTSHTNTVGFEKASVVVQPSPGAARKTLVRNGYQGRYVDSGHLVYVHEGTLYAAPFDLGRLELVGPAVPTLEGVKSGAGHGGGAQFASSRTGTLVFLLGSSENPAKPIEWMDGEGNVSPLMAAATSWTAPAFSPDGRRLAMQINDGKQDDIWVYEWDKDHRTRLTFDTSADDRKPAWTPDGRRISFNSTRGDGTAHNLYWQRADGNGQAQRLTVSKHSQAWSSWHATGRFVAFQEQSPKTRWDVMVLEVTGDETPGWKPGVPTAFVRGPSDERHPDFSPDGRWLAYCSNETGKFEVYVRPFPGPGGVWQVSSDGGDFPVWSRVRHELFYVTGDGRIMAVPYVDDSSFHAEKPRIWSDGRLDVRAGYRPYDLHPDGQRFAVSKVPDGPAPGDKLVFVLNFFDELRRIAPVPKK